VGRGVTPHYADDWLTVYAGDCRAVLATLPAESVHCVVTSPPYWGLRDYGTATWDGGDAACDHLNYPGAATGNKGAVTSTPMRGDCLRCGATRIDNQLGLEPTPEQYVENMVAVFREVKRVLRNDGTLWLNLGDSYAGSGRGLEPRRAWRAVPRRWAQAQRGRQASQAAGRPQAERPRRHPVARRVRAPG
jgi:DNA modification methylase